MNRPSSAVTYRAILAMPRVRRSFIAVNVARLSYSSLPLALLLTVQHATGSYAVAGIALGASAGATVVMPIKSRLIDRLGPRLTLPALAAAFGLVMVTLSVCSAVGVHSAWVYVVLCAAAGFATPPVGPSMRALLFSAMPSTSARQRAYALDGTADEAVQVAGPLVVAAVLTTGLSGAVLVVIGALNVWGAVMLSRSTGRAVSTGGGPVRTGRYRLGLLHERKFGLFLLLVSAIALGAGPFEVAIVARCGEFGAPSSAAFVLAALSVGSAAGGVVWGRWSPEGRPSVHLSGTAGVMAAGCAIASVANNIVLLTIFVALGAIANAPTRIVEYLWADRFSTAENRTEATTWVSTAANVGGSVGVSAGGVLVQYFGAAGAMMISAASLATVGAVVILGSRSSNRGTLA